MITRHSLSNASREAARFLNNPWKAVFFCVFVCLGFFTFWLHGNLTSPNVSLYRANLQAASGFVATVNAGWPDNRSAVLEKLTRMTSAYRATGENDPTKLGEIARLKDWTMAAVSVASEQQYLTEVREQGMIVAEDPFFEDPITGIVFSLLAGCFAYIIYGGVWFLLSKLGEIPRFSTT